MRVLDFISPMLHLHFWNDQNRSNICDSEESCLPLAAQSTKISSLAQSGTIAASSTINARSSIQATAGTKKRHDDAEYAHLQRRNVHPGKQRCREPAREEWRGLLRQHSTCSCTRGSNRRFIAAKKAEPMRDLSPDQAEFFFLSRADRQPLQMQSAPVTGTRNSQ